MWQEYNSNNYPTDERRWIMYIHEAWMALLYRRNGNCHYSGTDMKVDESIVAQIKYWKYDDGPE